MLFRTCSPDRLRPREAKCSVPRHPETGATVALERRCRTIFLAGSGRGVFSLPAPRGSRLRCGPIRSPDEGAWNERDFACGPGADPGRGDRGGPGGGPGILPDPARRQARHHRAGGSEPQPAGPRWPRRTDLAAACRHGARRRPDARGDLEQYRPASVVEPSRSSRTSMSGSQHSPPRRPPPRKRRCRRSSTSS